MQNLFRRYLLVVLCGVYSLTTSLQVRAWGPEGHAIVAKLAMQFLKPDVRERVIDLLGTLTIESAANWMDMMRSNSDYDFMKPWHYVDFGKNEVYKPSTDENIINRMIICFRELQHKKVLPAEQARTDLLILMHLAGDLTQPLHCGYDDDLGGNRLAFQYDTLKTNLHKFWDEDLIGITRININDCLEYYNGHGQMKLDTIKGFAPDLWMQETRSLLPMVYDYPGFTGDNLYLMRSKNIVIRQLVLAAIRLAYMLDEVFIPVTSFIDMKEAASKFKDGIEAADAVQFIGKKVTACGRVYGVKITDKVVFMNVADKFPNAPLTVVIFAKDLKNFPLALDRIYNDRNICIKGSVVEYNGKAEIIISDPSDIIVLDR